jgi:hypothetical protein
MAQASVRGACGFLLAGDTPGARQMSKIAILKQLQRTA